MQPSIRVKSELPVGKYTTPDQSARSFTVVIDNKVYHLLVKNHELGEGKGGGFLTFFPRIEGLIRGSGLNLRGGEGLNKGFTVIGIIIKKRTSQL